LLFQALTRVARPPAPASDARVVTTVVTASLSQRPSWSGDPLSGDLHFVAPKGYRPETGELRFDMYEGEYTHEGDRCTFQTLCAWYHRPGGGKDDTFRRDEVAGSCRRICASAFSARASKAGAAGLAFILFA
jgi:hypothetical protein